MTTRLFG